jgi:hypothetical protein
MSLIPGPEDIPLFIVVVGGVLIIGIAALIISWLLEKKRTRELREVALANGFQFIETSPPDFILPREMKIFERGYGRRTKNILHGEHNQRNWTIFEYQYQVGAGKSSQRYLQTVFLTSTDLPRFYLTTENLWHKLAAMVGYNDVDFESFPTFSKRYYLKSPDERIRSAFSTDVLTFFEREPIRHTIESQDHSLALYRPNVRLRSRELMQALSDVERIVDVLAPKR